MKKNNSKNTNQIKTTVRTRYRKMAAETDPPKKNIFNKINYSVKKKKITNNE